MKARVEQLSTQQDVTLVKRPLKLTIGILVSNSKNTIRRCLDSIKPLLEQVSSELIITDTGGTDGAIEIAKEYTDKIEKFTWCNDFAAARNVALQKAQGEWFLYLDDDEWFENTTELIEFFNSDQSNQYKSLIYSVRNYQDYSGKKYTDCAVLRCARLTDQSVFEGIIHETLSPIYLPQKQVTCFAHHYGYAMLKTGTNTARGQRNIPLLEKELEKNKQNFRVRFHLAKEYLANCDYKKAIDTIEESLKLNNIEENFYFSGLIKLYISACFFLNDYKKCLLIAQSYLKYSNFEITTKLFLLYIAQKAAFNLNDFETVYIYGKQFEENIIFVQSHPEITVEENWSDNLDILRPCFYHSVQMCTALALLVLQKYTEFYSTVQQIDFSILDAHDRAVYFNKLMLQLSNKKHLDATQKIYTIYSQISDLKQEIINHFQAFRRKDEEAHRYFAEELSQIDDETDAYIWLNRTYLSMLNQDKEALTTCWNWFLDHVEHCAAFYEDILLYAMEQELDIAPFVAQMDFEDWQVFISTVLSHPEQKAFHTMMNYFQNHQSQQDSLKLQYWVNCMRENILLHATAENGMKAMLPIFQNYAEGLASYMHHFYAEEAFTGTAYDCLPRVYRFAYQMEQAFEAKKQGNVHAYMDGLKSALKAYPVMKEYISLLVEKLEEEQQETSVQQQEFLVLAKTMKSRVEQLITARELEQAEQLIAELSSLLPNDADLGMYRLLIQQAKLAETSLAGQVTQ